MKTRAAATVILATTCALFVRVPFLNASDKKSVPNAPIPSQILAAKRIFIANAGEDETVPEQRTFSGGPDRAYNQIYDAVKNWDRYQIVSSPSEADLILEVEVDVNLETPIFRLAIRDPKNDVVLWRFKVRAEFGIGQGASDENFDRAINRLVWRLRALVEQPSNGSTTP